jgi:DNA polymerase-3 subunit gamma/tau
LLRDLLLAGVAPDRLELTSVSPALRPELPAVARSIGKARLLHWQAQLKGSEQQLRHSVQPRLWLEVLLLGLLAEPLANAEPARASEVARARATASVPAPMGLPGPGPNQPPHAAGEPSVAQAAIATPAPTGANPGAISAASGHSKTMEGSGSTETNEATREPTGGETRPAPIPATPPAQANLGELWQQILASLELPSTRMLLSQQATLHRLDERRAVVRVAGNWIAMVQSRLPLLEGAMAKTFGSPRQVSLEAAEGHSPPAPPASMAPITAQLPSPLANVNQTATETAPAAQPASGPDVNIPSTEPAKPSPGPAKSQNSDPDININKNAKLFADFFNGEIIADQTE